MCPVGTKWVTQADLDAFNTAIASAETVKDNAVTILAAAPLAVSNGVALTQNRPPVIMLIVAVVTDGV
jgi:hypothetical protein